MSKKFERVAICVSTPRLPPLREKFRPRGSDNYACYLSTARAVFTIDATTWDMGDAIGESTVIRTCPDREWIDHVRSKEVNLVLGMCEDHVEFRGLTNLEDEKPIFYSPNDFSFRQMGFDVMDASGLSALSNLALTAQELSTLNLNQSDFNESGLICDYQVASHVSKLVDGYSREHAPFYAIQVWTNI
jgi:hypothetical protein